MGKVYKIRDLQVDKLREKQIELAKNNSKIFSETDILHSLIEVFLSDLTAEQIEENCKKKKN